MLAIMTSGIWPVVSRRLLARRDVVGPKLIERSPVAESDLTLQLTEKTKDPYAAVLTDETDRP